MQLAKCHLTIGNCARLSLAGPCLSLSLRDLEVSARSPARVSEQSTCWRWQAPSARPGWPQRLMLASERCFPASAGPPRLCSHQQLPARPQHQAHPGCRPQQRPHHRAQRGDGCRLQAARSFHFEAGHGAAGCTLRSVPVSGGLRGPHEACRWT